MRIGERWQKVDRAYPCDMEEEQSRETWIFRYSILKLVPNMTNIERNHGRQRMTLGEKLRELRLGKRMTLQDVAEKTGYSKALFSRI